MQIIIQEIAEGKYGLFDTRSNKFIPGGRVRDKEDTNGLLEIANNLVRKSPRTIHTIIEEWEYIDGDGRTEAMIAKQYFALNPDLAQKARELLAEKPTKKTRKRKEKIVEVDETTGEVIEKVKGKPGRPKRIFTEEELQAKADAPKRGKGRPKKENQTVKTIVLVDGLPRKRGRPSKASLTQLSTMTI